MEHSKKLTHLREIFTAGVESVDPQKLIEQYVHLRANNLHIRLENEDLILNLDDFSRVIVLGAGKATARMAKALEEVLGTRIDGGIISVKYGHTESLRTIKIIEAGHPVPDRNSVRAANQIKEAARKADKKTLIICLISGGGSALLASPLDYESDSCTIKLTLEDLQETTRVLLGSGATIQEMNCIRKHLSGLKGGRLAGLAYPALQVNLILSDVVGDKLDAIASGLTTSDDSTWGEALSIMKKYDLEDRVPENIIKIIHAGAQGLIAETPKDHDDTFTRVRNILIGSNYTALRASSSRAASLGYSTVILSSRITGEAREVAKVFAGIAKDTAHHEPFIGKPACIIGGGETTVTIKGSGKGGRNQEFALSFLLELADEDEKNDAIALLAASTDGNDGPTDAAGAFASTEILKKSEALSLNGEEYLKNNDSYTFFEKTGYLLRTGPTNTNVCDIQIVIVT